METFEPKEQIVYVPNHAKGDIGHPGAEFGFVTTDAGENGVFCRYWVRSSLAAYVKHIRDGSTGEIPQPELRTKANSELTPRENIVKYNVCDASIVDHNWNEYVEEMP